MSLNDIRTIRLNRMQARKLVTQIVHKWPAHIRFSKHALEELRKDNLTTSDALNVIKSPDAKIMSEGELEKGSYRYRLETNRILVVISFDTPTSFVVITAWRKL